MRDFSNDHSMLALNTATLGHNLDGHGAGWSPEQVIDACAARGIGGIVFWRREIGNRAIEIGERARAAGLTVCGLCRTPFLVGPLAPPTREQVIAEVKASIDMAAALQAPVLTVVVGGVIENSHSITHSLQAVTDIISEVIHYAAQANVQLALEPLNPVYGGNRSCLVSVRDAVDICNTIDHAHLGIAIDVYHVWWDTSLDLELQRAGGQRLLGYHLCDWLADTKDVLLDRGMMGDGVADLRALRAAVEGAGYNGFCEVEVFSAENWWKQAPEEVLDTIVKRFREHC